MNLQISFAPQLPPILLIGLPLIALALLALLYWRNIASPIWRLAMLAILTLALFNPRLDHEQRQSLSDIAVLVTDQSQSQNVDGRTERTRLAAEGLRTAINALPNTQLREVSVTSAISSQNDGTRAITALKSALADIPPERFAGAIIITDGQVHDAPNDGKLDFDGPVHALITARKNEQDRRITLLSTPRFAIVGQQPLVRFKVEDIGNTNAKPLVNVEIKRDGVLLGNIQTLLGEITEFPLPIDHGGQNITELTTPVLPGELTARNNHAVVVTQGVRDRLRVLLVSGKPHPGERTWRNLLKADASVDLVHFTILRPPEKQDGTPIRELSLIAFPTRELFVDKLDDFDLIIFDRYRRRGVLPMSYLANIAGYVERGGAVLVAAGPDYAGPLSIFRTPLATILSAMPTGDIHNQPYRAKLSKAGMRHPVTHNLDGTEQAPKWGHWLRLISATVRDGTPVMLGPNDEPLLLLSRHKKGRVAELLTDQAWLWTRGFDGGGPQAELLRRLAHWLMKEPELEEEALSGKQNGQHLTISRRTMADKAPPVEVTNPSGDTTTIELQQTTPGMWQATLTVSQAGIYTMRDGTLTAVAAIGSPDPREITDLAGTEKLLAPLVKNSLGGMQWISSADGKNINLPRLVKISAGRNMAGNGWLGLQSNNAYQVTAIEQIPLFNSLIMLALLLMLTAMVWYRESR